MSFTTYATAIAGSVLTAAFWNAQVRDNGLVLKTSVDDNGHAFVSTRYTTTPGYTLVATDDFVITNQTTISLPASPVDGKPYTIKSRNVAITVSGNGNTIDGLSTFFLGQYDAANFIYNATTAEWSVY